MKLTDFELSRKILALFSRHGHCGDTTVPKRQQLEVKGYWIRGRLELRLNWPREEIFGA